MGWMWVFWFMLFAALVLIVLSAARAAKEARVERETFTEALKRRYAQGDISREEYEAGLKDLQR